MDHAGHINLGTTPGRLSYISRRTGQDSGNSHLLRQEGDPARNKDLLKDVIMRQEYDFSKAERGKFFRPDAKLNLPVYLDEEVRAFVQAIAEKQEKDLSSVVNQLLRGDMRLSEAMK